MGDYRPAQVADDKMKKKNSELSVELVRNPDILSEIGSKKRQNQLVCGFSMETRDLVENSRAKLEKKNCDMVQIISRWWALVFAHDTNVATLLYRDGSSEPLTLMQKDDLADLVLDRLLEISRKKEG